MNLENKVVVVTGASAGIGKATAEVLAKEKATVVLVARRLDKIEAIAKTLGPCALAIKADVSQEEEVQKVVDSTVGRFGRIDVWINNAGIGLYGKIEETTGDAMERIWRTNVLGTFYSIRSVLPVMRKQGKGQILTICSTAGKRATPLKAAYCSSKFAQIGLMESLRMELRSSGIKCTLVYPGATESEFLSVMENPGNRDIPYSGPVQKAEDVASAIVAAIYRPRAEVMTEPRGRIVTILNAISPGFVDWLVSKTVKRKVMKEM